MNALAINFDYSVADAWESPVFAKVEPVVKPEFTPALEKAADIKSETLDALYSLVKDEEIRRMEADKAASFIRALPLNFPEVEPYASSVGSVCLDWDDDIRALFSVIVQRDGKISYALRLGGEQTRGILPFEGGHVPDEVISAAKRWRAYASAKND